MSQGAIQVSPPRLSARIFARGSVSERTQSSSARVQNRHHSRPRASAVSASNRESMAVMSIDTKDVVRAQYHRSLNDVLEFTDIARPIVCFKEVERMLINAFEHLACLMCISMEEIFEQHHNILSTFSKRRDTDRKYVQTIEEIRAELCSLVI